MYTFAGIKCLCVTDLQFRSDFCSKCFVDPKEKKRLCVYLVTMKVI